VPIYDYICRDCGQRTEVIHGIDAPGPKFCPACGAEGTLRKAFVAPTVHYRGSGWAKKDRSATTRSRSRADGETAKGSEGSSPAKDAAGSDAKTGSEGSSGSSGSDGASSSGSSGSSGGSASGSDATAHGSDARSAKRTGKSTSSKDD